MTNAIARFVTSSAIFVSRCTLQCTRGRSSSAVSKPNRRCVRSARSRAAETSGDRCECRPQPSVPFGYQHHLPHHQCIRRVALASHRRRRSAGALHRPPGSHDLGERTCSQCKMSARAGGSRRPPYSPAGVALSIIKR